MNGSPQFLKEELREFSDHAAEAYSRGLKTARFSMSKPFQLTRVDRQATVRRGTIFTVAAPVRRKPLD
jgi:hypothetical protein